MKGSNISPRERSPSSLEPHDEKRLSQPPETERREFKEHLHDQIDVAYQFFKDHFGFMPRDASLERSIQDKTGIVRRSLKPWVFAVRLGKYTETHFGYPPGGWTPDVLEYEDAPTPDVMAEYYSLVLQVALESLEYSKRFYSRTDTHGYDVLVARSQLLVYQSLEDLERYKAFKKKERRKQEEKEKRASIEGVENEIDSLLSDSPPSRVDSATAHESPSAANSSEGNDDSLQSVEREAFEERIHTRIDAAYQFYKDHFSFMPRYPYTENIIQERKNPLWRAIMPWSLAMKLGKYTETHFGYFPGRWTPGVLEHEDAPTPEIIAEYYALMQQTGLEALAFCRRYYNYSESHAIDVLVAKNQWLVDRSLEDLERYETFKKRKRREQKEKRRARFDQSYR